MLFAVRYEMKNRSEERQAFTETLHKLVAASGS